MLHELRSIGILGHPITSAFAAAGRLGKNDLRFDGAEAHDQHILSFTAHPIVFLSSSDAVGLLNGIAFTMLRASCHDLAPYSGLFHHQLSLSMLLRDQHQGELNPLENAQHNTLAIKPTSTKPCDIMRTSRCVFRLQRRGD